MRKSFYERAMEFFASLPKESTREYEKVITDYSERYCGQSHIKTYERIAKGEGQEAYAAFFCLCTIFRRSRDYSKLNAIIEKFRHFEDHVSYNHIRVMYLVHSESIYDYDMLLQMACEDAGKLPDNPGYQNTFANAFATICENCSSEDRESIAEMWYEPALKAIDKAIDLEPEYAKFYATKARVIAQKERYDEAVSLLMYAVSMEKSTRPDYALAIMNYQYCRQMMVVNKKYGELDARIRRLEHLVRDMPAYTGHYGHAETDIERPKAYAGDLDYAFVSYSHYDSPQIHSYIDCMQAADINVWYDEGIPPGEEWIEVIGEKIIRSSVVVVFLSNNSMYSKNVRREIVMALNYQKPLVVVRLEDVIMTPGMELQFGLEQIIIRNEFDDDSFAYTMVNAVKKKQSELTGV